MNVPPGLISPDSKGSGPKSLLLILNMPEFTVCMVESSFVHVIFVPAVTEVTFGLKDSILFIEDAPGTIDILFLVSSATAFCSTADEQNIIINPVIANKIVHIIR
jgi:hypothetical protein